MTVELTMLAYAVALLFVLIVVQATVGVRAQGLTPMAGPRDNLPEPKPFQARMKRVVDNHREGLILFAPLVLIAAAAHITSPTIAALFPDQAPASSVAGFSNTMVGVELSGTDAAGYVMYDPNDVQVAKVTLGADSSSMAC